MSIINSETEDPLHYQTPTTDTQEEIGYTPTNTVFVHSTESTQGNDTPTENFEPTEAEQIPGILDIQYTHTASASNSMDYTKDSPPILDSDRGEEKKSTFNRENATDKEEGPQMSADPAKHMSQEFFDADGSKKEDAEHSIAASERQVTVSAQQLQIETNNVVEPGGIPENKRPTTPSLDDREGSEKLQGKQPDTVSEPFGGAMRPENSPAGLPYQPVVPLSMQGPVVQPPAPHPWPLVRKPPPQAPNLQGKPMATDISGRMPGFQTQQFNGLQMSPVQAPTVRFPQPSWNIDQQENIIDQMANSTSANGQNYDAFNLGTAPGRVSASAGSQAPQPWATPEALGRVELVNPPLAILPQHQQAVPVDQSSAAVLPGYQSPRVIPQHPPQQVPVYVQPQVGHSERRLRDISAVPVDAGHPPSGFINGQQSGPPSIIAQFPHELPAPPSARVRTPEIARNGNLDPLMPLPAPMGFQNRQPLMQTDNGQPLMAPVDGAYSSEQRPPNGVLASHPGGGAPVMQPANHLSSPFMEDAVENAGGRSEETVESRRTHEGLPLLTTVPPITRLSEDKPDDSKATTFKVPLSSQGEVTNSTTGTIKVSFTKLDKGKLKFGKSLAERVAHDRFVGTIVGIILSLFIVIGLGVFALHLYKP
ncbi:unnamed protein product [Dibothriocephalus latus]|uniref:Uncharacterized protein n=1 Tax=Dibothriocephalus latus TaxID=60516 RepID=A0A3P6T3A3_DIBLA|nr:unnamed protein product [Dibothriocephalus latus]